MEVHERVVQYIRDMGIKQNVIAAKTGLSERIVSDIMNSKRKMSADEFAKICKAIGKEPNDFMISAEAEEA